MYIGVTTDKKLTGKSQFYRTVSNECFDEIMWKIRGVVDLNTSMIYRVYLNVVRHTITLSPVGWSSKTMKMVKT